MRALAARLLLVLPALVGVTLVTFALVHLLPGDPAELRAGEGRGVSAAVVAENRALAGLDSPLPQRYAAWLARSARLDFGASLVDGRSARLRVAEALPRTAALGLLAALFAIAFGLSIGAWSAVGAGRAGAAVIEAALSLAYGVPALAVGLLLLRAGAPYGGVDASALLAPAACLALPSLVVVARQERAALQAVLASDFVRTARAKGASPLRVVLRHALPPSLLPMVALFGSQVPVLLSGSVIVERVFGIPGLGSLGYEALLSRDYPVLMALASLTAVLSIAGMLIADGAALLLDPRLRSGGARTDRAQAARTAT